MRRGLTLGKFAPFHRGHQLLVETALHEVDELVILVYATDVIDVPLQVRAGWIHELYPATRIIEAWDGPDGYGATPEICREQEKYILKKLNGLRITHFYSSEFYGDHVSRALGAIDRRIDEARKAVPISGSALREDYHGSAGPVLTQLATKAEKRYDLFFLCDIDIPYANTWDRSRDQKRRWFQDQIIGDWVSPLL